MNEFPDSIEIDNDVFREKVSQAIDDYAELVANASLATSMSQLDEAGQQYPKAPYVHKMVTFLLKLERKGLCSVKLSDYMREQLTAAPMSYYNPSKPDTITEEWVRDVAIAQVAAFAILEAEMFIEMKQLAGIELDLVPDISDERVLH